MEEPDSNPYQSPRAELLAGTKEPEAGARPSYKLYSAWSVAVASLLGTPCGGGIILAINYDRLGRGRDAVLAVVGAFVFWVAVGVALGWLRKNVLYFPGEAILVVEAVVVYGAARFLQGNAIKEHHRRDGILESGWTAAGIGLLISIVISIPGVATLLAWPWFS